MAEPTIQEQIEALEEEMAECQKLLRDDTLDKEAKEAAREKIQEDWQQISHLRKLLKAEGADMDGD